MKRGQFPWFLGALFQITWALSILHSFGCGSFQWLVQRPEVKKVSVSVTGLDFQKADLRFDLEVENAGSGTLTVAGYDYELQVDGQPFLRGTSQAGFDLPPHAVTVVQVPVSVQYGDLLKKLVSLKGRAEVPYNLAVTLTVRTSLGEIHLPLQKEGRLPVLTVPTIRLQAIRVHRLTPRGMSLEALVEVAQPGGPSISLASLAYALTLNGVQVGTGSVGSTQVDGRPDTRVVRVPVDVDGAKARSLLAAMLSGENRLRFVVTGEARFTSPFGNLSLPFTHSGTIPLGQ